MSNLDVLKEISDWSIEAKDEDTSRYFFHFDDVTNIINGTKNYVIGRKGTGKTAIAAHLHMSKMPGRFSRLLSFKNFPFNSLYALDDKKYNRPNQYITIWTYVIYHYICSMMADNEQISSKCSFDLKQAFDFDIEGALDRSVNKIIDKEYSISVLGIGGGFKKGQQPIEFDFSRANDALRKFIVDNIDESEYFIIFDELDEDYRDVLNPDRKDGYFELLVSLFKSAQNVRAELSKDKMHVRPVIFLRDDIFDLCRDVDKNKWLDRAVTLNWSPGQLRQLTNFRLAQAVRSTGINTRVDNAWRKVFSVVSTSTGGGKRLDTFNFIISRTFLRPRDVISYVRECARGAVANEANRIDNIIIKDAAAAHAAYMRREVIDELFPVLDDVAEILGVLTRIRKQIFTRKEFNDRYREFVNQKGGGHKSLTETQVLKLLYHFNVLGNITTGNHRVFAYNSEVKMLNEDENLCVHNGLIHALKIL